MARPKKYRGDSDYTESTEFEDSALEGATSDVDTGEVTSPESVELGDNIKAVQSEEAVRVETTQWPDIEITPVVPPVVVEDSTPRSVKYVYTPTPWAKQTFHGVTIGKVPIVLTARIPVYDQLVKLGQYTLTEV